MAELQNKTKFLLAPFLMLILVGMGVNQAYASTLSDSVEKLEIPDITINPKSGPVGTGLRPSGPNYRGGHQCDMDQP